jgi:5-methylcytosine-specific restriction protein A
VAPVRPRLTTLKPQLSRLAPALKEIAPDSWRSGKEGSTARGYGYAWQKARDGFLREYPLCVLCRAEGRTTAADVVDHTIPHRGDQWLFWDRNNWRPLCKPHHDSDAKKKDNALST